MEYEIMITEDADADLAVIERYLAQFYPGTPKRFRVEFERKMELLEYNPHYARYSTLPHFRKINVGGYIVLFTVDEETRVVTIHHVRHGMREPFGG